MRPSGWVWVQASSEHQLQQREHLAIPVISQLFGSVEPVIGVLLILVDLTMRLLIVEKEGEPAIEDLVGDDSDREDIIFLGEIAGRVVALGRAVGHGKTGCVF